MNFFLSIIYDFAKECHQMFIVYLHLTWDLFSAHVGARLLLVRAEMFTNDPLSDICLHMSPLTAPLVSQTQPAGGAVFCGITFCFSIFEIFGLCPTSKQSDSKLCAASSKPLLCTATDAADGKKTSLL